MLLYTSYDTGPIVQSLMGKLACYSPLEYDAAQVVWTYPPSKRKHSLGSSHSVCFAVVETSYEAPVLIFQGKNKHGALQKCFWICGDKIKKKNPCNNRA
jgi:hypothetical protein